MSERMFDMWTFSPCDQYDDFCRFIGESGGQCPLLIDNICRYHDVYKSYTDEIDTQYGRWKK